MEVMYGTRVTCRARQAKFSFLAKEMWCYDVPSIYERDEQDLMMALIFLRVVQLYISTVVSAPCESLASETMSTAYLHGR